jgi:hypothetical protein
MACATWQARSPAHLWMVSRYRMFRTGPFYKEEKLC